MSAPVLASSKSQLPRPDLGWPLLPMPDEDGQMKWPDLHASVKQMIEVILRTSPGEQLMRPAFGAGLERMIHNPNTVTTRSRIRDNITESLRRYERRIIVDQVEVSEDTDPNIVQVAIYYRLRHNGQPGAVSANVTVGGA